MNDLAIGTVILFVGLIPPQGWEVTGCPAELDVASVRVVASGSVDGGVVYSSRISLGLVRCIRKVAEQ